MVVAPPVDGARAAPRQSPEWSSKSRTSQGFQLDDWDLGGPNICAKICVEGSICRVPVLRASMQPREQLSVVLGSEDGVALVIESELEEEGDSEGERRLV